MIPRPFFPFLRTHADVLCTLYQNTWVVPPQKSRHFAELQNAGFFFSLTNKGFRAMQAKTTSRHCRRFLLFVEHYGIAHSFTEKGCIVSK